MEPLIGLAIIIIGSVLFAALLVALDDFFNASGDISEQRHQIQYARLMRQIEENEKRRGERKGQEE